MPDNHEWIESIERPAGDDANADTNTVFTTIIDQLKGDLGSKKLTAGEIDQLATELIQITISNPEEGQENQDED